MSLDANRYERINELFSAYCGGRISRRDFVRGTVAIGGVTAMQALLAACAAPAPAAPTAAPAAPTAAASAPTTAAAAPTPVPPGATQLTAAKPTSGLTPQNLVYAGGQDAPTIDPSDRTDYSISALSMQVYDRLFRYEGGWPQPIDPCLCTKYEASPDGKEWTLHLTDKAKFHDGSPVTAEAVQFSINRTLQLQKPQANSLLPIMNAQSVQTPDQYTVKITLTQPYSELPRVLVQGVMNPKLVKDNEVNGDLGAAWLQSHEAGSGPFTIKNWTVGSAYELEAVPDYWQGWPGQSRLAGFTWKIVRENTSQRIGLISKQFDIADTLSADDLPQVDGQPHLNSAVNYGILTGYTKLNDQKEPTNNADFRHFLAFAFDYEAFKQVVNGYAQILSGVIPQGIPYFDASVGGFKTDLDQAKAYLAKTPWANGGVTLDYVYVTGLSFEQQIGEIWQSQLGKFNINVNLIPKVWPDIVASCKAPDNSANMNMIFTGYTVTDQWFFYQWYSPNWDRPTGGDFNTCSFTKDTNFNGLVEKVRATTDETEKKNIYSQLQTMIHGQVPDIPIYVQPNILGLSNRVQGYKYFGAISVDFWRLWLDDSKALVKPA
jgi:peptide/nickel transport system substrate-binding protein